MNANIVYFTFDEGNNEMMVLPFVAEVAAKVSAGEASYYGAHWQRKTYDEMLADLKWFIVNNGVDMDPADDAEPDAAVLAHYLSEIASFPAIDEAELGATVWDFGVEDGECVSVNAWDIRKLLQGEASAD